MAELVAKRYAGAIFEVSLELKKEHLVEEELQGIVNILETYPEFNQLLISPLIQAQEKKEIISSLLKEKISPEVFNFLLILVDKRRIQYIQEIVREYTALAEAAQNRVVATAVTAEPMVEEEIERLKNRLSEISGKAVTLNNEINREIIGGVLIKIGNKVIDGTVKNRLSQMKDQFAQIIV